MTPAAEFLQGDHLQQYSGKVLQFACKAVGSLAVQYLQSKDGSSSGLYGSAGLPSSHSRVLVPLPCSSISQGRLRGHHPSSPQHRSFHAPLCLKLGSCLLVVDRQKLNIMRAWILPTKLFQELPCRADVHRGRLLKRSMQQKNYVQMLIA